MRSLINIAAVGARTSFGEGTNAMAIHEESGEDYAISKVKLELSTETGNLFLSFPACLSLEND